MNSTNGTKRRNGSSSAYGEPPPPAHDDGPSIREELGGIPANLEAEASVLGSCLLNPDALPQAADLLLASDFYRERNGWIFEAMLRLHERREPPDLVLLSQELERMGRLAELGGPAYLTELLVNTPSAFYVQYYAGLVKEAAQRRRIITVAGQFAALAYDRSKEMSEVMEQVETLFFQLAHNTTVHGMEHISLAVERYIEQLNQVAARDGALTGIPTGYEALDRVLGGFQRSDMIVLAARPAMGKCLGKGTKVLMFDGTLRPVEDVRSGDLLMGDDSTSRRVRSITRGKDRLFRVNQTKGISYVVNSQHVLTLKRSRNENGWQRGEVIDVALPEYLAQSNKWKSSFKGYKVAVDFPEQAVSLDPYILGLWLGDGASANSTITNPDIEIIEALGEYADTQGKSLRTRLNTTGCPTHRVTEGMRQYHTQLSMQEVLRSMGVLGNKHIPQNYLVNSRQVRLELLAGLIDTDGYYTAKFNVFEIVMTNQRLVQQIKFLADTLGFKTSLAEKSATIKATAYQTQAWRVRISGNLDQIPTRVQRKQARPLITTRDWQVSGITVEPAGVGEYFGFELDGNGRFLLEDMTVTHNSSLAFTFALTAARRYAARVAVFSLEMSDEQSVSRWLSMSTRIDNQRLRLAKLDEGEWTILMDASNDLSALPIYIDDTAGSSMSELRSRARRIYAEQGLDLIIVDYMQLIAGQKNARSENRHQEISRISKGLKALAKELNVPVIALSQLSRDLKDRADKRPQLWDLKESGSIEEDADVVMFVHRDDYYDPDTERQNIVDLIIAKHRHGATGTVYLWFNKELTTFSDIDITRTDLNNY